MEQIRCIWVGASFVHQLLCQLWQGTGQAVQANLLCIVALQCIYILAPANDEKEENTQAAMILKTRDNTKTQETS